MSTSHPSPARTAADVAPAVAWWVFIGLLGVAWWPASSNANMADPYRPGDRPGALSGGVEDLRVERERLVVDLRDLTDTQRGRIEATYEIYNDDGPRELELQFVAGFLSAGVEAVTVELDGEPVDERVEREAPLPSSWHTETDRSESRSRGRGSEDEPETATSIFFEIEFSEHTHKIRVAYPIELDRDGNNPVDKHLQIRDFGRYSTYSMRYLLAPLHEWGEVGEVEIVVRPPRGDWKVRTEPELDRRNDGSLAKTFDNLEFDTLGVVTAPKLFYDWRTVFALAAAVVALVIYLVLAPLGIARLRRRVAGSDSSSSWWPVVAGLSSAALVLLGSLLSVPLFWFLFEGLADSMHTYPGWGYGMLFFSVIAYAPLLALFAASYAAAEWFDTRNRE